VLVNGRLLVLVLSSASLGDQVARKRNRNRPAAQQLPFWLHWSRTGAALEPKQTRWPTHLADVGLASALSFDRRFSASLVPVLLGGAFLAKWVRSCPVVLLTRGPSQWLVGEKSRAVVSKHESQLNSCLTLENHATGSLFSSSFCCSFAARAVF